MKTLLATVALSALMLVAAAASETKFTNTLVLGCKSKSNLEWNRGQLTLVQEALRRAGPTKMGEQEFRHHLAYAKGLHETRVAWLHRQDQNGGCYFFAKDTKVVIDEQSAGLACVRVAGTGTWLWGSDDFCFRFRTVEGCGPAAADDGNVEFICRKAQPPPEECTQRHGAATTCVWVSTEELAATSSP